MSPVISQRRQHFRLYFKKSIKGIGKIVAINNKKIDSNKQMALEIEDLSGGGMKIRSALDLPENSIITLQISFAFEKDKFIIKGEIIRKKSMDINEYGINFIDFPTKEEQRLIKCLNQHQVKRVKKESFYLSQAIQSRAIESVVKIIEVLNCPAYLISAERTVIAANQAAQASEITLGEKCYSTIYNIDKNCPHCRMDQAFGTDEIIKDEIVLEGEKFRIHWLYLENGVTLHYLKKNE